jgi:Bacterial Ig domain
VHTVLTTIRIGALAANFAGNAPIATHDTYATSEGVSVDMRPLDNDYDLGMGQVQLLSNTQPANGSLTNMGDGTFRYTPNAGFLGLDSFQYRVQCLNWTGFQVLSKLATVTINVTSKPPLSNCHDSVWLQGRACTGVLTGSISQCGAEREKQSLHSPQQMGPSIYVLPSLPGLSPLLPTWYCATVSSLDIIL